MVQKHKKRGKRGGATSTQHARIHNSLGTALGRSLGFSHCKNTTSPFTTKSLPETTSVASKCFSQARICCESNKKSLASSHGVAHLTARVNRCHLVNETTTPFHSYLCSRSDIPVCSKSWAFPPSVRAEYCHEVVVQYTLFPFCEEGTLHLFESSLSGRWAVNEFKYTASRKADSLRRLRLSSFVWESGVARLAEKNNPSQGKVINVVL